MAILRRVLLARGLGELVWLRQRSQQTGASYDFLKTFKLNPLAQVLRPDLGRFIDFTPLMHDLKVLFRVRTFLFTI